MWKIDLDVFVTFLLANNGSLRFVWPIHACVALRRFDGVTLFFDVVFLLGKVVFEKVASEESVKKSLLGIFPVERLQPFTRSAKFLRG